MAEKSSPGTRQTDGKNLVSFGEIERKLAKLSMPTFAYRSSSSLFYDVVPLPGLKGTLLRNQATSAAGLALETLQDTSTFSFSRFSMRDPDRCPTNSIRFGGTEQKVTELISIGTGVSSAVRKTLSKRSSFVSRS
jgi:hypothetical protein